jgi:DNA-binding transcriptional ArsR family regulator
MTKGDIKNEIRDLRDGDWYWIDKAILSFYARKLRASGIAVYNALAFYANTKTQTCFPTQQAIAELLGLSGRTVRRKIRLLKELGLIKVKRKRGGCLYCLLKPLGNVTNMTYKRDIKDLSDRTPRNPNNNYLTRINNNIIDEKNFLNFNFPSSKEGFIPKTREELLALDLAEGLNDYDNLALYLYYSKRYPETLLRSVLGQVKEIPLEKIKKGRVALFNHLIQRYTQKTSGNSGD